LYLTVYGRNTRHDGGVKAGRLISLLHLLEVNGGMTAQQLSDALGISLRTVYRDVETLQQEGYPVYSDRGPLGGYRLVEGFRTRLTGLTSEEAETLFLAGLPGPAGELGLSSVVAAAELKVLAALPPEMRRRVAGLRERFHLDAPTWFKGTESVPFLAKVAAAVWVDRRIHVRYLSWEGESDRTLDPLGLVLKSGLWYLAARSPRKVRIYRVSRILSLEMTDQTFNRDPFFDLAIWWTEASAEFEKTLYQAEAVLLVSPQGMHQLELRLNGPAPRVLPPAASSAPRGWKRVRIPIVSFEDARYELLQLGADAIVESPNELRDAIGETVRKMDALYGG
jgi:predicted DNA-binding transcriptional regulator YafY